MLSGFAFTASFATFGIFGGLISDRCNRSLVIGVAAIAWSTCTLLIGSIDSFVGLFVFIYMLGFFESAFNPCAYSIIADNFHPDYRTTANSLFNSGIYLGGAMASLTALVIAKAGWRAAYSAVGMIGMAVGVLCLLAVREP